jgi:hypothetical protein
MSCPYGLRQRMLFPRLSNRHPGTTRLTPKWPFFLKTRSLFYFTGSSGVPSHDNREGLFWIRNKSQRSVYQNAPVLGSAYGNQPYRSFREQTVPPSLARNSAQHQHVRQHDHQHFGQCGSQRFLLRRRSGWWRVVSLCSLQNASRRLVRSGVNFTLLLRGRSGWRRVVSLCSLQNASRCLVRSGVNCTFLLRGRSGWRRVVSRCPLRDASRCLVRSDVNCTFLLRGRSRWWRVVSLCSLTSGNHNRFDLMPVGRFSDLRGGQ